MNIFLYELRSYRKSIIVWICSMGLLVVFLMSIYPDFSKNAQEVKRLLEGYPIAVRKALGITFESFFSILGFYSYAFAYITLFGAIQAMNLGLSIISKEVRQKTGDFLLTKPVSRIKILTSKLLAALMALIITNIFYLIIASYISNYVKLAPFSMKKFIMISITLFFIQLIFLSIGILISVIVPKLKSILSVSLGTVFGLFILNMFGSVIGDKTIRYLTPFKYYDVPYIIKNESYEVTYIIIEIAIIAISILLSYIIYSKKDIHAV